MTPQNAGLAFAGVGALGTLFSSIGQYQSGEAQKAAYNYNAAVTLQDMQKKEQESEAKFSTLIGRQVSSYAKAGVDIASGSPLLIMAHTAQQSGQEQEREQQAGTEEENLQKYYGRVAAWSGTSGSISSFLSGMSKTALSVASLLT